MKKVTVGNLVNWNGAESVLAEFIDYLENQPHLDDRHAQLLSELTVAYNNFSSSTEEEEYAY